MTQRFPSQRLPYAALAAHAQPDGQGTSRSHEIEHVDPLFADEARRLQQIRGALWDAFAADRSRTIPHDLIDFAFAYAGILKLQLKLHPATPHSPQLRSD